LSNIILKKPLEVGLEVTPFCNLNCKYCYAFPRKKYNQPTLEELKFLTTKVLDEIQPFKMIIEGGEPFLRDDLIIFLQWLLERFEPVAVTTNGTCITPKIAENIKKLQEEYELHIQVSLDSHVPEIHNATRAQFQKTCEGIMHLLEKGVYISVGIVVHKQNIDTLISTQEYLEKLGVTQVHLMNLMPSLKAIYHMDELRVPPDVLKSFWKEIKSKKWKMYVETPFEKELSICKPLKQSGCYAGITKVSVLANGDVLPCSLVSNKIMGNILKQSWEEIWDSKISKSVREADYPLCYEFIRGCGIEW
jgi:MoaA/NifB/PqqE/SkfB family radical SAM enzyme